MNSNEGTCCLDKIRVHWCLFVVRISVAAVPRLVFQKSWFGTSMNWMELAPNTRQMPTILVVAVEAAEMQYNSIACMATDCHLSQSSVRSHPVVLLFAEMATPNAHRHWPRPRLTALLLSLWFS